MLDKYIYNFLMWVNHYSTKLTSWSWCKLYSDRNKGYGNKRRHKNSVRFLKKKKRLTETKKEI